MCPPPRLPPTMPFLESGESGNTEESIPDVCFPSNSVQLLLRNNPLLSVRFESNPKAKETSLHECKQLFTVGHNPPATLKREN